VINNRVFLVTSCKQNSPKIVDEIEHMTKAKQRIKMNRARNFTTSALRQHPKNSTD